MKRHKLEVLFVASTVRNLNGVLLDFRTHKKTNSINKLFIW